MTTTIKLSGGDLGREVVMVRCNLTEASAPVEVDYCEGMGWQPTQWQCANCAHRASGLASIGKSLAAQAVEMERDAFDCDWEEVVEPEAATPEMKLIQINYLDDSGNVLASHVTDDNYDDGEIERWREWLNDSAVDHPGAPEHWSQFELVAV